MVLVNNTRLSVQPVQGRLIGPRVMLLASDEWRKAIRRDRRRFFPCHADVQRNSIWASRNT
jgi:hypothetical protein